MIHKEGKQQLPRVFCSLIPRFLHKSRDEIMAMCLKDPASLLSMRMSECAFQVAAAVLHCEDSLVIEMNEERVVIGDTQSHQLLR